MSNKQDVIKEIFLRLSNLRLSKIGLHPVMNFDNDEVKEVSGNRFRNQFDVTKVDNQEMLPDIVRAKGYYIMHLGGGNHAFVKGSGYHEFERIRERVPLQARPCLIDNISESEAQSISTAFHLGVFQHFLLGDEEERITMHPARRARRGTGYNFIVGNQTVSVSNLTIEIDAILEWPRSVATVEAKKTHAKNFEIRQLFSAANYFANHKKMGTLPADTEVMHLFLVRTKDERDGRDIFRVYQYRFKDLRRPESIELVRALEYFIA